MALFDSSDDKNKEAQPGHSGSSSTTSVREIPATLRDVARSEPLNEPQAAIGRGSRLIGKLHFDGNVRIDGSVEGELSAGDLLQIGERATVNAQITGTIVVIRGNVTGDVHARKRVEVRAPGRLRGNVTTPSLVIDDGVTFEGYCSMGGEGKGTPPPRGGIPAPK